jgi:Family of unknown function (DUF5670)
MGQAFEDVYPHAPPSAPVRASTQCAHQRRSRGMLLTIAVILVVLWLFGFFMHIAGGLIHVVLVIALIMFVLHFVRGRRV